MSERRGKTSYQITCSLNILCELLYLCESSCGLATIRNDNFLHLGDWMIFKGGGGHMVFRGSGVIISS